MSSRLRIRLFLVVASCVIAAGVASSLIQRASARADFSEYQQLTQMRAALLDQDSALQSALAGTSARPSQTFRAAEQRLDRAAAAADARHPQPEEKALLARQVKFAADWTQLAERALVTLGRPGAAAAARRGERARDGLLGNFLAVNRAHHRVLAEKRVERQRTAMLLPLGLVASLVLAFGLVLVLGVERPARADRRRRQQQEELGDALQVARTEPEAYEMLAHHVTRSSGAEHVTILNRNNSADRLVPVSPVREGSAVAAGLEGAAPDACLAVRLARPQSSWPGDTALLSCELCGKSAERTTCVPSLVGGEVVGSVLVEHVKAMTEQTLAQVVDSVADAAPVVANLRSLAIAELRAETDGLTGLANQRAVHETLKRMVAQAGRTVEPLAVILFDLDHFKQINDSFGHARGDDVLAAVGDAAANAVRGSDFAGRLGGEEFALLLPGTGRAGATDVAENVRAAISSLQVSGVERAITASFGVAVLPDDAADAESILRIADRALYLAKSNGRDRVEVATV